MGGGGGLEVVFMVNKYMNLRKSKKFKNYRVTHKGWDFTDDITEFIEAFFLHQCIPDFECKLLSLPITI